jgi:hypothetical protein
VEVFPTVYPPKPRVVGGLCEVMLPYTCDDDCCLLGKLGRDVGHFRLRVLSGVRSI